MTRPRIGITMGDPAGIGPEITRAALASGKLPAADYRLLGNTEGHALGRPTPAGARVAQAALEEAAKLALAGEIDAVVTGPVHKARLHEVGFPFPGQTEFFAARCGIENFAMLLTGARLTVALVTTHIPLCEVAKSLRSSEIMRVGLLLENFLARRGGSRRIAVAGLNPHAGESGALGQEEIEIIAPAIAQLRSARHRTSPSAGRTISSPQDESVRMAGNQLATGRVRPNGGQSAIYSGPISPDTVFHRALNGEFDAVLCMYHDQGLIPLKLHAFHEGVNVTLGLPFPRTSPDHGTAFAIAGQGIARADSMSAAIRLAVELAQTSPI